MMCLNSQGEFVAETEMESVPEAPDDSFNLKASFAFMFTEKQN